MLQSNQPYQRVEEKSGINWSGAATGLGLGLGSSAAVEFGLMGASKIARKKGHTDWADSIDSDYLYNKSTLGEELADNGTVKKGGLAHKLGKAIPSGLSTKHGRMVNYGLAGGVGLIDGLMKEEK